MAETESQNPSDEFWLFGYGSLIWKPPPHYDLRIPGHIKGYVRRFWQASEDHRGTPSSPGRVVTLITQAYYTSLHDQPSKDRDPKIVAAAADKNNHEDDDAAIVRGVAYRIPRPHVDEVKRYLDVREINGYSIEYTVFYPSSSPSSSTSLLPARPCGGDGGGGGGASRGGGGGVMRDCLVYIGLPSNPQFRGVQTQEEVAGVIAGSEGPSGRNDEYLFMLEEGLREWGEEDEHVGDLARRVRVLLGEDGGADKGEGAVGVEMRRVETGQGGKAAEETEKMAGDSRVGE